MAKTKSTSLVTRTEETQALDTLHPDVERKLAEAAAKAKGKTAGIGGGQQFVSIKGGKLMIAGNQVPNNEAVVVVLAFTNAKAYYDQPYQPDVPASPVCYAYGDDIKTMTPHTEAEKRQCDECASCRWNEFGTARMGKGKACRDSVKLCMIQAGTVVNGAFIPNTQAEFFKKAEAVYLSVPPTSMAAWVNHVATVQGVTNRPPFAVFTRIKVEMGPKDWPVVKFSPAAVAPNDLIPVLVARAEAVEATLATPFPRLDAGKPAEQHAKSGKKSKWK